MKCMAIKLNNKQHNKTVKPENLVQRFVFTKSLHSYAFSFIKNRSPKTSKSTPQLAVTNLTMPEELSCNTGSSLERWKRKAPRLRSAKIFKFLTKDDEDFCYETLESSSYFLDLDEEIVQSEYNYNEIDRDVHELILKSEQENRDDCKRKKSRKKSKKRKIKFSITSPPSPATEQIIRVDVTSTVEEFYHEGNENEQHRMIDEERKELKGNLNRSERGEMYNDGNSDDDFIVKCRQLALKQRHR